MRKERSYFARLANKVDGDMRIAEKRTQICADGFRDRIQAKVVCVLCVICVAADCLSHAAASSHRARQWI